MNVLTEDVIVEIHKRPIIWDSTHIHYKDRAKRAKCWQEVCEALLPEYRDEEIHKKKKLVKIVQQRWRTVRDSYNRWRKEIQDGNIMSKNKLNKNFNLMKFLDKRRVKIDKPSKDKEEAATSNDASISFDNIKNNADMELDTDTILKTNDATENAPDQNGPKTFQNMTTTITEVGDPFKLSKNDDYYFFMSLLPITETFNIRQKMIFRTEILKNAMKICDFNNPFEKSNADSSVL